MMRCRFACVVGLASGVLLVPNPAFAQDDEPERHVSLTLSPIHLIMPIVEVTGELKIVDHVGAAVILGGGKVGLEDGLGGKTSVSAYEGGAQFSLYPLQTFESLHFGVEALYLYIDASDWSGDVSASGEGFAVGPFVGYKLITSGGFTFVAQLGAQYVTARAEAHDDVSSESADDSAVIPLLNLNIGWSF